MKSCVMEDFSIIIRFKHDFVLDIFHFQTPSRMVDDENPTQANPNDQNKDLILRDHEKKDAKQANPTHPPHKESSGTSSVLSIIICGMEGIS